MSSMIRFLQSGNDFPLTVSLDDKAPSWGLSRWGVPGLRFLPSDDEGFTLRGDKRRGTRGSLTGDSLLYRGRKKSHRFTILGDSAFEYDCILNREPESNVVSLVIDGAERFDFFRQPDFIRDPYLAGSYAVYKKETLAGEGTGKLCHIYRPKIIDSRGRQVWGDLSIDGNRLDITIPETWLSEAKYPVVVDPTVGTAAVGSQNKWVQDEGEDPVSLVFELAIPVNRFLVSETINGTCTAYVYTNEDDSDAGGRPVIYSDNGNKPLSRRSAQEGLLDLRVTGGKPKGWRSAAFGSSGSISGGSYIWFGVFTDAYWLPRFDYGARCYTDLREGYGGAVPNTYPLYSANYYDDFKLSMYFTYTSGQSYTRTLTQGVTLSDTRKVTGNYYREHAAAFNAIDTLSRIRGFYRAITEPIRITELLRYSRDLARIIAHTVWSEAAGEKSLAIHRDMTEQEGAEDSTGRRQGLIRTLLGAVSTQGIAEKVFTWFRGIRDEAAVFEEAGHWGDYLRGLYTEAGGITGTQYAGEYRRNIQETAGSMAVSPRRLFLFIRLVTAGLVRDYLIPRFLKAREELVLKSPVCRELVLDSRIH
jgi:hypothetical protein